MAGILGQLPFLHQQPDHLGDEERIAFGLGVHRFGQTKGWVYTCG